MAGFDIPEYVHVEHFWKNGGIVRIKEEKELERFGDDNWKDLFSFGGPSVTLKRESAPFRIKYDLIGDETENNAEGHAVRTHTYRHVSS